MIAAVANDRGGEVGARDGSAGGDDAVAGRDEGDRHTTTDSAAGAGDKSGFHWKIAQSERDALKGVPYRTAVENLVFVDARDARGKAEFLANAILDGLVDIGILFEKLLRVLAPLTETLAGVREPRAALFDDALVDGEIEEIAGLGNPFAVHDVELGFAERRRDLVLHHFDPGAPADY